MDIFTNDNVNIKKEPGTSGEREDDVENDSSDTLSQNVGNEGLRNKGFINSHTVDREMDLKNKELVDSHTGKSEVDLRKKEHVDLNTVKVKSEPGNLNKDDIAVLYTEVEIEFPDVKKEFMDISIDEGMSIILSS